MSKPSDPYVRQAYDEIYARIGDGRRFVVYLREGLALHGITQGQLARAAGYSPRDISRWLRANNPTKPSMSSRLTLDEAYQRLLAKREGG